MRSVVTLVLSWNGSAFLRSCLDALHAQEYAGRHAVLVVDNSSTDGSADLVAAEYPDVALIRGPQNLGFAGGNNLGLRALHSRTAPAPADFSPDLVILLNQDTEVAPGWLAGLAAAFEQFPQAGAVGCLISGPDGRLQHSGGQVLWPLAEASHRSVGEAPELAPQQAGPVEWVTGAALGLRMDLPPELTLLDEGFQPAYFEDVDLCYRIRAAGYQVIYSPAAQLLHHENTSLGAQSAAHQRAYHRNRWRFLLRHGPLGAALPAIAAAERAAIARWSTADSLARKAAYRDALLDLPAILGPRNALDQLPAVSALLRDLHRTVTTEERNQRADSLAPTASAALSPADAPPADTTPADTAPIEPKEVAAVNTPAPEEPVDVAAIMREVRRKISERQTQAGDNDLEQALSTANQSWDSVYAPLHLPPASSRLGRAWALLRDRLHGEVRSYLDPMIFRQSEFNGAVVRTLNGLFRARSNAVDPAQVEALRDEVIMLREEVRRLREIVDASTR